MTPQKELLTTTQKALTVNGDGPWYQMLAAVGARQVVTREFFHAGAPDEIVVHRTFRSAGARLPAPEIHDEGIVRWLRTLGSMVRLMWRVVYRRCDFMYRVLVWVVAVGATAGCSYLRPSSDPSAPNRCYVESGWLDSSNGCSVRAGYSDCYLVCPDKGTRERL